MSNHARSGPLGVAAVVLGLLGVVTAVVVGARVARFLAPWLYEAADADHARLVLLLTVAYALVPLSVVGLVRARRRWGRWVLVGAPVPAVAAVTLVGYLPGRGDSGELSRTLSTVTGAYGAGDVFTGVALGALLALLPSIVVTSFLVAEGDRTLVGWLVPLGCYAVTWTLVGVITLAVVGDTPPRGQVLPDAAEQLRRGDDGPLGGFDPGLRATRVEEVTCEDAAALLERDDGSRPSVDGCRTALAVSAVGLTGPGRREEGRLEAVVLQVRWSSRLDDLAASVDDVVVVDAPGGEEALTLSLEVSSAQAVLVAAEDPGGLPVTEDGAAARPLTRALAYLVTGAAEGLFIAPPVDAADVGRRQESGSARLR